MKNLNSITNNKKNNGGRTMKKFVSTAILFFLSFIVLTAQTKVVDEMPTPVGGIMGIQKNVVYPENARKNGISGKVIVEATIDENGNVVKTKILKSADASLDEAAVKAIENTKFTPAKKDNKTVKMIVAIPIMFKLDSDKKKSQK